MGSILILKDKASINNSHLIDNLSEKWRDQGIEVIVKSEKDQITKTDIVIFHIDRSIVEDYYNNIISDDIITLNSKVKDISKRVYSRNILNKKDSYSGRVIVKSNFNYGGQPEATRIKSLYFKFARNWHWRTIDCLEPYKYPIYENMELVPAPVWENNHLIVEKFLPEKEQDYYFVRYWIFLGNKGWAGRFGSRNPIVKFGTMETEDEIIEPPKELKELREKLSLDYGRIDYVERDGESVVFDVNKTMSGFFSPEMLAPYSHRMDTLASGIYGYL